MQVALSGVSADKESDTTSCSADTATLQVCVCACVCVCCLRIIVSCQLCHHKYTYEVLHTCAPARAHTHAHLDSISCVVSTPCLISPRIHTQQLPQQLQSDFDELRTKHTAMEATLRSIFDFSRSLMSLQLDSHPHTVFGAGAAGSCMLLA